MTFHCEGCERKFTTTGGYDALEAAAFDAGWTDPDIRGVWHCPDCSEPPGAMNLHGHLAREE